MTVVHDHPPLKPCPFCGGPVRLELARVTCDRVWGDKNGERRWYGVVCRNTINHGYTCCMDQVPSASIDAAVKRWNMRDGKRDSDVSNEAQETRANPR